MPCEAWSGQQRSISGVREAPTAASAFPAWRSQGCDLAWDSSLLSGAFREIGMEDQSLTLDVQVENKQLAYKEINIPSVRPKFINQPSAQSGSACPASGPAGGSEFNIPSVRTKFVNQATALSAGTCPAPGPAGGGSVESSVSSSASDETTTHRRITL